MNRFKLKLLEDVERSAAELQKNYSTQRHKASIRLGGFTKIKTNK
jgi:hypothetical protein